MITAPIIHELLSTVLDPELGIDIVSLGLIYDVSVSHVQTSDGEVAQAHIVMTLTTPGCPLAGTIEDMIRRTLDEVEDFDAYKHLQLEITFDPPWVQDMMSEEARAELGLD